MNKRHINAQLGKVFHSFIESIEDDDVKYAIGKGTIITGGALVSLLTNEEPHDYDLYFKDFKTCYKVAAYFVHKWNSMRKDHRKAEIKLKGADETVDSKWIPYDLALEQVSRGLTPQIKIFIKSNGVAGDLEEDDVREVYADELPEDTEMQTNIKPETDVQKELEEEPKYVPKFLTSNAISLTGKIQLIIRFYGEPSKIHENYDFVHCTNYWTSWDTGVVLNQAALESIINKELRYVGSRYPLCSVIRTRKFITRGWTINAGQYLKMLMQLNELDLMDIDILEDQLVGVDTAYFEMLIEALRSKKESDPGFEIDNAYVTKIVDKLF